MLKITNTEASARILTFANEGRLVQSKWHGMLEDGRELACLLGSLDPSVKEASQCNGDLMPLWMAELTVTLFDGIPPSEIVAIGKRYGALIARWDKLTAAQWSGILTAFLVRVIDDAVADARPVSEGQPYWPAVEKACSLCRDAVLWNGDKAAANAANAAANAAAANAYSAAAAKQMCDIIRERIKQPWSES